MMLLPIMFVKQSGINLLMKLLAIPLSAMKHALSGWLCAALVRSRAALALLTYCCVCSGRSVPASFTPKPLATVSDAMYKSGKPDSSI